MAEGCPRRADARADTRRGSAPGACADAGSCGSRTRTAPGDQTHGPLWEVHGKSQSPIPPPRHRRIGAACDGSWKPRANPMRIIDFHTRRARKCHPAIPLTLDALRPCRSASRVLGSLRSFTSSAAPPTNSLPTREGKPYELAGRDNDLEAPLACGRANPLLGRASWPSRSTDLPHAGGQIRSFHLVIEPRPPPPPSEGQPLDPLIGGDTRTVPPDIGRANLHPR